MATKRHWMATKRHWMATKRHWTATKRHWTATKAGSRFRGRLLWGALSTRPTGVGLVGCVHFKCTNANETVWSTEDFHDRRRHLFRPLTLSPSNRAEVVFSTCVEGWFSSSGRVTTCRRRYLSAMNPGICWTGKVSHDVGAFVSRGSKDAFVGQIWRSLRISINMLQRGGTTTKCFWGGRGGGGGDAK